ncbi:MAG: hypothetical protein AAF629_34385, partial [Chloroflexota bacterium]
MITINTKLGLKSSIAVGTLLIITAIITYMLFFQREVDSVSQNGPLTAEIISINQRLPLMDDVQLAAGIAYDTNNDRFFISTDQPHGLLTSNEAHFFVLNQHLDKIEFAMSIQADGDLEGVTVLDAHTAIVISELGTLIYLVDEGDNDFSVNKSVLIFEDGLSHKLGSLAYDYDRQHIYTAEKEDEKVLYKLDQDGNLLESITLQLSDQVFPNNDASLDTDYTIAGMTYSAGFLYLFSEAYSTIFKFNVETQRIEDVFGVDQLPEVAGITLKGNDFYLIG